MTDHSPDHVERAREVAAGLMKAQAEKLLGAVWHGSGATSFATVEATGAALPASLVHMMTLRWDRLTPLGLAVRAALHDDTVRGEGENG